MPKPTTTMVGDAAKARHWRPEPSQPGACGIQPDVQLSIAGDLAQVTCRACVGEALRLLRRVSYERSQQSTHARNVVMACHRAGIEP